MKRSQPRRAPHKTKPHRTWKVHVSAQSRKLTVSPAAIRTIVHHVLRQVDAEVRLPEVNEIHVVLINDARMREMNFEFRKKDKTTDVLSFPQFTPEEISGRAKVRGVTGPYLGDLVISTETTVRQARAFGVTVKEELTRLVVHGILHLCGYDHERVPRREADRMRRRERVIRNSIRL